jgi:hypothetical protein
MAEMQNSDSSSLAGPALVRRRTIVGWVAGTLLALMLRLLIGSLESTLDPGSAATNIPVMSGRLVGNWTTEHLARCSRLRNLTIARHQASHASLKLLTSKLPELHIDIR